MANLKDILNAAGEISLYAGDPEWKNKRMAQIRAGQAHDAMLAKTSAETAAIPERVDNTGERNMLQVAQMASRSLLPDEVEQAVAAFPDNWKDRVRPIFASAAAQNASRKGAVDAGAAYSGARTRKTDTETDLLPASEVAKRDVNLAKSELYASQAANPKRSGGGGPKAPTASKLGADLRAAQKHLLSLQDKEQTGLLIAKGGPKAIASAQAEVDRLQRLVNAGVDGEASNAGGGGEKAAPTKITLNNAADADRMAGQLRATYATMLPAQKAAFEKWVGQYKPNAKAFLSQGAVPGK